MEFTFSQKYEPHKEKIKDLIARFEEEGRLLNDGTRNKIKVFDLDNVKVNVKSFKVPNAVNKVAYRFIRKSKAERSYKYAHHLLENGVGTPYPIAYAETAGGLLFLNSFYLSEHLENDLTYRDLVENQDLPNWEDILRAFTRFTFSLHEKNIEFLDHSPGNTLIKAGDGGYRFFLVDLNRMNFRKLDFKARMKNFSRLTPHKEMVRIMADEYSRLYGKTTARVFEEMWRQTQEFQEKFQRKRRLKKKIKFWRKYE